MRKPLIVPVGFDVSNNMFSREVDGRVYHSLIPAVRFIPKLVENGTETDLALAERMITAVLACQEKDPTDPHIGNFLWEREDEIVEDLNAVQFALFNLIPMMVQWKDRLEEATQTAVLKAIRLGLEEIQRLDVGLEYTNIVLKDITNSCLGGELLNDDEIANRGYSKLLAWMQFTNQSGLPTEYNSPAYATIALEVLNMLATKVNHKATSIRAKMMLWRLGLSTALHIHPHTARLSGPFSRAYRPTVFTETPPEGEMVRNRIVKGLLPDWLNLVLRHRPIPMSVVETADAQNQVSITTFLSHSFSFGVATKELTTQNNRFIALQSNVCIAHYDIPGQDQAGVLFSRYILDDKWVGDFRNHTFA